ncbi:MAG: ATP-binding protein [Candidatus Kapabacteria bacterium]|jgi:signal transduction histidine kinase|nr:ATP-binding protein [Candidatus Kapabacteria bacterium]
MSLAKAKTTYLLAQPLCTNLLKHVVFAVLGLLLCRPLETLAQERAWTALHFTPTERNFQRISSAVEIFCDSSGQLSIAAVMSDSVNFRSFSQFNVSSLNFGFSSATYWMRVHLRDTSVRHWYLLFLPVSYTDSLVCYVAKKRSDDAALVRQIGVSGAKIPLAKREIAWRSAAFVLPKEQEMTVFVRFSGAWIFSNEPVLMTEQRLESHIQVEKFIYGLFVGIVVALSLYNLFLYLRLRDRASGFYLLYILFFSVHILVFDSLLHYEIFPHLAPDIPPLSVMILPNLAGAFLALFAAEFLHLKEREPRLWRINQLLAIVSAVIAVLAFPLGFATLPASQALFPLSGIIGFASTMIIVGAAVQSVIQKRLEGFYFLAATSVFLVSMIVKMLANFMVIQLSYGAYYGTTVGFLLQLLLFSFALADRIRVLQRNLQEEQEHALRAEEEARAEHSRNEALEVARTEILAQKIKVQDQNLMIEASNWELQQVNETLIEQQRLLEKQTAEAEKRRVEMEQAHKETLQREESILRQRDELAYQKLVLEVAHNELVFANDAISKQKAALEEKQETIEAANIELQAVNAELMRQQELLEEQTVETEMLNTELQERNNELRLLSEERSELLGIVSHDLKNPIASIQGLAEMLSVGDDVLPIEQRRQIISLILQNSSKMSSLVKNLLDVNAIEQGSIHAQLKELDASLIVGETLAHYQERAAQKEVRILFSNEAPIRVMGDEQMLLQVMDNLVSNAVKYSQRGKAIHIYVEEYSPVQEERINPPSPLLARLGIREQVRFGKQPLGVIVVRDEGAGIPVDELPRLFGKFVRLSTRPTEGEDSTGLGLSIVKKFVEKMNGEIWCESEPGKGSVFVLTLPLVQGEASTRIPETA